MEFLASSTIRNSGLYRGKKGNSHSIEDFGRCSAEMLMQIWWVSRTFSRSWVVYIAALLPIALENQALFFWIFPSISVLEPSDFWYFYHLVSAYSVYYTRCSSLILNIILESKKTFEDMVLYVSKNATDEKHKLKSVFRWPYDGRRNMKNESVSR